MTNMRIEIISDTVDQWTNDANKKRRNKQTVIQITRKVSNKMTRISKPLLIIILTADGHNSPL